MKLTLIFICILSLTCSACNTIVQNTQRADCKDDAPKVKCLEERRVKL